MSQQCRFLFRVFVWVVLYLYCPSELPGQDDFLVNFRSLNLPDGLSHREVFDFHQDEHGLMWIATRRGLNRYDGHRFKWWTAEEDGLSQSDIKRIERDENGKFWLIGEAEIRANVTQIDHLDIFDPSTETIQSLTDYFADQALPFTWDTLRNIHGSEEGGLIFYSKTGQLWIYRSATGFSEIPVPTPQFNVELFEANSIWLSHKNFLYQISFEGVVQTKVATSMTAINALVKGPGQTYAILGTNEVNLPWVALLQGGQVKLLEKLPGANELPGPVGVTYDKSGQNFWIASTHGLVVVDKNGSIVMDYDDEEADVIDREVHQMKLDRDGLGWLATSNGIVLAQVRANLFERYLYLNPRQYKMEDFYRCRGILVNGADLYVNVYGGRHRVDLSTGAAEAIATLPDNRLAPFSRFPLFRDRKGRFWAGDSGLVELDPENLEEQRSYQLPKYDGRTWSILDLRDGQFLLGDQNGLRLAHPGVVDTVALYDHYNEFTELRNSFITDLVRDREGLIWILSTRGLYRLEEGRGVVERYSHRESGRFYLPTSNIQHLHLDEAGIYWLATSGEGLIRWDRSAGELEQYDRRTGFSNNNIYAVYEDDFDHLWMSSDYGILQFDKETHRVKNYGVPDGISFYEFNRISHYQDVDGRIYFGSLNGVTAFDPKDFYPDRDKPHSPILADFTMFEGSKGRLENKTAKVWQGNAIELDPEERIYRLEVAQLDYFNSDKIIYNYRLDGRDRRWKSLRGNEIAIEGVTPGQYTLRVRARKTGYSFGDQELRIPLLRNVAFYRRPEFLTLLTLLCFGMIWWWQRLRNLRLQEQQAKLEREVQKRTLKIQEDKLLIEKQAEELREQDRLKTRFFNNIAHELRTPLTLISGPVRQLLQRSSVELEEQQLLQLIRQNSEHLLQKVKYMLDLAKLEAKQLELHPRQMDLRRFFEQQLSLFTSLARTQKIDLQLEQRYAGELWLLIDEEKLSTIVQNLLSNALKYTPSGGRVLLRWSTDAEQLMIEVIDSGGGIPAEDLPQVFNRFYQVRKTNREGDGGTGIGLALTRELVELMGGQIGVESSSETGSRFWIRLPLKVLPSPHAPEPVEEAFVRERPLDADEISDWQNQTKPTVPPVQAEALGTTPKKHRGNILLVEDNPELREYLGLVLADYHLVAVGDGQEALDWLSQTVRLPQLIISDIMMPVMDGFTLLERLKAAERTSMIPVILLTARAEVKDRRRALRIGVDDYVTKPFVAQELLVKVETLLQHAGERKGSGEAVANVNQQRWLAELEQLLLDNLSTRNFTQDQMAAALHISKRQLSRRIKKLTGLTTNQYLREIRLHQARQLLEDGVYATIAEVSYAVGFEDQHYFSNLYFQRFAIKPIAYFTPSNEDAK